MPFTLLAFGFFGGTSESGLKAQRAAQPTVEERRRTPAATTRLRFRTAFGATPFAAVTVIGNEPAVVGVPERIAGAAQP